MGNEPRQRDRVYCQRRLGRQFAPSGANFNGPVRIAIDAASDVWVTNTGGNSVTELTSNGSLAGNFDPSGANFNIPDQIAIDAAGDVWVTNFGGNSVTELTASGALAGNFDPSGAHFSHPGGIAIDGAGDVWVANAGLNTLSNPNSSVTELNSSGGLVGNFVPIGAHFDQPSNVAIDSACNVWVVNQGYYYFDTGAGVSELVGAARPVLTPLVACLRQSPPHAVCLP